MYCCIEYHINTFLWNEQTSDNGPHHEASWHHRTWLDRHYVQEMNVIRQCSFYVHFMSCYYPPNALVLGNVRCKYIPVRRYFLQDRWFRHRLRYFCKVWQGLYNELRRMKKRFWLHPVLTYIYDTYDGTNVKIIPWCKPVL